MKALSIKYVVFFCVVFIAQIAVAQSNTLKKQRSDAEALIDNEEFAKASLLIESALVLHPNDKQLNYDLGLCYLNLDGKVEKSILHLEQATVDYPMTKKMKGHVAIEARYYLGLAYHKHYEFEKALNVFYDLKKQITPQQKMVLPDIDREIRYNTNAIELSKTPVKFKISNLGAVVNTPFDEHSPVVSADESTLIFTSNRKRTEESGYADESNYEDLYISQLRSNKWTIAQNMGSTVNTQGNNASISLSHDGKLLLLYQYDGISGDIYQSELKLNGWSTPEKLPKPINSQYNETHASFSLDGNTIYFTSDRPGGFGKQDIYMARKLPNGEFGKIINLGPVINTAGNEESPCIHPDGKTLYFCSTEHQSMGGYDIFQTTINDSVNWSVPANIGFPINTPNDDVFYVPTVNGLRVYYASVSAESEGGSDIYLIEFVDDDPRNLSVVAGYVFDKNHQPFGDVLISLVDKENGDVVGYYRPSSVTGKYVLIVPAGRSYIVTYTTDSQSIVKEIDVSGRLSYSSGNWATYIDAITIDSQADY